MARMVIAFVGAYILGRLGKFKLAIAWFGLMTGYKLKLSPEQLLEQGSRLVEASPQLQQLVAALRGPLLEAAKQAATSAATAQLSGLTDKLVDRIENLGRDAEQAPTASSSGGGGTDTEDERDDDDLGEDDRGGGEVDQSPDSTQHGEGTDEDVEESRDQQPRRRAPKAPAAATRSRHSHHRSDDAESGSAGGPGRPSTSRRTRTAEGARSSGGRRRQNG